MSNTPYSSRRAARWKHEFEQILDEKIWRAIADFRKMAWLRSQDSPSPAEEENRIRSAPHLKPVSVEYVPPDAPVWFAKRYPAGSLHVCTHDHVHLTFGVNNKPGFDSALEIVVRHVTHDINSFEREMSQMESIRILAGLWPDTQPPHGEASDAVFLHSAGALGWDLDFVCRPDGQNRRRMLIRLPELCKGWPPLSSLCLLPEDGKDNDMDPFARLESLGETGSATAAGAHLLKQALHWRMSPQSRKEAPRLQCLLLAPDGSATHLPEHGALMNDENMYLTFDKAININHCFSKERRNAYGLIDEIMRLHYTENCRIDSMRLLQCAWECVDKPSDRDNVISLSRLLARICRYPFEAAPAFRSGGCGTEHHAEHNKLIDQMASDLLSITQDDPVLSLSSLHSMLEEEMESIENAIRMQFSDILAQSSPKLDAFFVHCMKCMERILSCEPDIPHFDEERSEAQNACMIVMKAFFRCAALPGGRDMMYRRLADPLSGKSLEKMLEWLKKEKRKYPGAASVLESGLQQKLARQVMREMVAQTSKDSGAEASGQQQKQKTARRVHKRL